MLDGSYRCCMSQSLHGSPIRRWGTLTLRSRGTSLSGTMFPTMFWLDAPFSGGWTDGADFSFTAHFATPCQQFAMKVTGRAGDGRLAGTVHSPMGEYALEGTRID